MMTEKEEVTRSEVAEGFMLGFGTMNLGMWNVEDGSGIRRVWGGLGRGEGVACNQELRYDVSQAKDKLI
jgi:hypothetical protein